MTTTASEVRAFEIRGTNNSVGTVYPRDTRSAAYCDLIDYKTRAISFTSNYESFPECALLDSGNIAVIWTRSVTHATSTFEYPLAIVDPDTLEVTEGVFNSVADGFDFTLLDPEMADGDSFAVKAWAVTRFPTGAYAWQASPVYLLENKVLWSDDKSNAAWSKSAGLTVSHGSIGAYGAMDGDHIVITSGAAGARNVQQSMTGVSPNQTVTCHDYLKYESGGPSWFWIRIIDDSATSNGLSAYFNAQDGTVGTVTNLGNGTGATLTAVEGPYGYWAVMLTGHPNTSGSNSRYIVRPVSANGATTYAGDGIHGWYHGRTCFVVGDPLAVDPSGSFEQKLIWPKTTTTAVDTNVPADLEFTLWGKPLDIGGGVYLRSGRAIWDDGGTQMSTVGCFESTDLKDWRLRGTVAEDDTATNNWSETSFALREGVLIAMVRNSPTGSSDDYIDMATSTDDGENWGTPTQMWPGVQPDNTLVESGDLIHLCADRAGRSGYSAGGDKAFGVDSTGMTVRKLPNVTSTGTFTVAATAGTITRAAGSFVADGFIAGQEVVFSGFTNAGNNATKTIDTVTATVITVTDNTGLVDETGGGDESVVLTPALVNWELPVNLVATYSTDGTYPRALEVTDNRLTGAVYTRRDEGSNPGIELFQFDTADF